MDLLRNILIASAVGLLYCGVVVNAAAATNADLSDPMSIQLMATQSNAGQTGKATLHPQSEKTLVDIIISGVPSFTSPPVHLYSYVYEGTCESHKPQPRFALTRKVLAATDFRPLASGPIRGPFNLSESMPITLQTIRASQHAISVRTSPADGNFEIFCGESVP